MACKNNMNSNSNLGRVIDLDVVYTGCGSICFGEEIKAGMTLRSILDVLITNCGGGIESVSWGDILGEIEDQTDLVNFINENISTSETTLTQNFQDLLDQLETDLETQIEDSKLGPDDLGKNLMFNADNKLTLGTNFPALGDFVTIISQDGQYPPGAGQSYLMLAGLYGGLTLESGGYNGIIATSGGNLNLATGGGRYEIETNGGENRIGTGGGNRIINTSSGENRIDTGGGDNIVYTQGGNSSISVETGENRLDAGSASLILDGVNNSLSARAPSGGELEIGSSVVGFSTSSGTSIHWGGIQGNYGLACISAPGNQGEVVVYNVNRSNNTHSPITFRYQVEPTLTNPLQIVHKGYVDALEATVQALEARVTALENA